MKLNFDFSPWISPVSGNIAFWQSFPDLPVNYTIEGDRENRPQPSSALIDIRLDIIELRHTIDNLEQRPYPDLNATYILQQPDANLPQAQALIELGIGMAKIVAGGAFAIAIAGEDYATAEQLQEIEQQCQQYAEQAATSAEEAATSAGEAATSAGEAAASAAEATGAAAEATAAAAEATAAAAEATAAAAEATEAAAEATGAAAAAGLSAAGAAASAISAGVSAGSASSSASDASSSASDASHSASNANQSATNASNSATQAETYLNTFLNTGLTLQGDVNGSGLLSSPIVTTFKPNPAFTGNQSVTIPVGNGSQRPTTLTAGMMRLNTGN